MARMIALLSTATMLLSQATLAAELPPRGPLPDPKPATAQTDDMSESARDEAPPIPAEKPAMNDRTNDVPAGTNARSPSTLATPQPATPDSRKDAEDGADAVAAAIPPTPANDATCRENLKILGTRFEAAKPIDDGDGCGIAAPISVSEVLPGIRLEPAGVMGCRTASALARWTKETVVPTARLSGRTATLTALEQASTYVCKRRNGATTGKISEHAHGNAVDIAALVFSDGTRLEMKPRQEDGTMEGALQRSLTAAACLHFSTVLSPGSDATHETHLHLDTIERKGGFRFCR